nr:guanine nucleotide-binding protein negative regulator 1 [Quercus suber]
MAMARASAFFSLQLSAADARDLHTGRLMSSPASPKNGFDPMCLATTGDKFCRAIAETQPTLPHRNRGRDQGKESNFFREAQFSADGTTIITHNEDQCLRTYILPPELLDTRQMPHPLDSYSTFPAASNIQSYAVYPGFQLQDASTTLVLSANIGEPLRLSNALQFATVHAKYKLIKQTTEEYLKAYSLTFTASGDHFVAGSVGMISVFDTQIDGSGPIVEHRTHVGKSLTSFDHEVTSMTKKGIVSALGISSGRLLAIGTTEQEVALYNNEGRGECATSFSIRPLRGDTAGITGRGVTKLAWSPCGTYLLVAERQSDGIQVFDVRNTFRRVAWLSGRQANTSQRLGIDVIPTASGYEVWGGGMDGCVRMWTNPGAVTGAQSYDGVLKMHIVATCSGKRFSLAEVAECDSDSSTSSGAECASHADTSSLPADNTLKVWTV